MSEETTPVEVEAEEQKEQKKVVTKPCLCSTFELRGATADEAFATGCGQTTQRTFAMGHDARLVSFLVDGDADGYDIVQLIDGGTRSPASPYEALLPYGEKLALKAQKATENRQAREQAKAERETARATQRLEREAAKAAEKAAKAAEKEAQKAAKEAEKAAAKATGAEVVAGSFEGDRPELGEGQAMIKVGRWEYVATIDEDGNATYIDGKGDETVVERDGYKLLVGADA